MSNYKLPYFDALDPDALDDYYEIDILLNEQPVQLDMSFDSISVEAEKLEAIKLFLDDLPAFEKKAHKAIQKDFETGSGVKEYVHYLLEEVPAEELAPLLGGAERLSDKETQLLNALRLTRVGFYPDSNEHFAVFDFTIGEDLTDYLLVVDFSQDGTVFYLAMES